MPKVDKQDVNKHAGSFAATLLRAAVAALLLWLVLGNMDWYDPAIALKPDTAVLGPRTEFMLEAADKESGLRSLKVAAVQGGEEKVVLMRTFTPVGGLWGSKGSRHTMVEIPVLLDAMALGLKEGKAEIVIEVRDRSWRNRFQGRLATLTREVEFSFKDPHGR